MTNIEIDTLRKCGIDPFKDYSKDELDKIITNKEKSWRHASQDSQKSESEKISLEKSCTIASHFLKDSTFFEDTCSSAQNIFIEAYNEELKKKCVLRSDGHYSISSDRLEDISINIIKELGWVVAFDQSFVDFDLILYKKNRTYSDAQTIFNKLRKINPEYTCIESWLNDLIEIKELRVEGCLPVNNLSTYSEFKNTVGEIQKRFAENAYRNMEARQNHSELINLIYNCILGDESSYVSFRTYDSLRSTFTKIDQSYRAGTLNDIAELLRGIKVKPGIGPLLPFIEDYFLDKGYAFNFYGLDCQILSCNHCGAIYKDDGQIIICSKCGNTLFTTCPKCGARCSSTDEYCSKCGSRNADLKKLSAELKNKFELALRTASFSEASNFLDELGRVGGDSTDVEKLRTSFMKSERRFTVLRCQIDECYKTKAINESIRLCHALKDEFPDSVEIDQTLVDLEQTKSRVNSLLSLGGDEDSMIDNHIAAFKLCTDDYRITEFLQNHPPQPLRSIDIITTDESAKISITGFSSRSNTTVTIIRKKNSPPISPDDGDIISSGLQTIIVDKTLTPGIGYYYSAFAIRGDIASTGVTSKRVVILPKPRFVTTYHYPDCVFGIVSISKEATGIRVTRTGNGEGCLIDAEIHNGEGKFKDASVRSGETYTYSVTVMYGFQSSNPISTEYTIPKIPIIDLYIKKIGKTFHASVSDSGPFTILLSELPIALYTNYLPSEIIGEYEQPKLTSGDFVIPDGYQGFAYAARDMGEYHVLSNPVPISALIDVDNVEYQIYRNDCTLMFRPPAKTESIIIRWSTQEMPMNSDSDNASSIIIPISQFSCNGNKIKLHIDGRDAYIRISMVYEGDRISDGYCMTIPISKAILKYSIKLQKKLFSKIQTATITFHSDWHATTINGLVIGIGSHFTPLAIDEAVKIINIPELSFHDDMAEYSFETDKEQIQKMKIFKGYSKENEFFTIMKE